MSMRPAFVAAGLLLLSSQGAFSQSASWSGPSIGINAGGGWGASSQRDTVIPSPPPPPVLEVPIPSDGDYGVTGALIGGGIGYNVVMSPLLFGIEADIDWSSIDGKSLVCGGTHECGTRLNWVSTVRGRVGLPMGATLLYVTGGLAVGEINAYDLTAAGFSGTKTKTGWAVGAGVEQKLAENWSVKLEYLFMDFGRSEYFTIPAHTPEKIDLDVHTVRIGLNYSFGGDTPSYQPLKR